MTPPALGEQASEATMPPVPAHSPDPFGLWLTPDPSPALNDAISFSTPNEDGVVDDPEQATPVAIWQLALTSDSSSWKQDLEQRAVKVQTIETGLVEAGIRAEGMLASRAAKPGEESLVSFAVEGRPVYPAESLPPPEAHLSELLTCIEAPPTSDGLGEVVSYGLGEAVTRLAEQVEARVTGTPAGETIDWSGLQQRFVTLLDGINQQLLHFAWVDTTLDGQLIARTAVSYKGDQISLWKPGLTVEQTTAHTRSLELAVASRIANLHTILTVSQIAGKIALAVTTPLGPLQALSLGWQFVQEVMMPLLNEGKYPGPVDNK